VTAERIGGTIAGIIKHLQILGNALVAGDARQLGQAGMYPHHLQNEHFFGCIAWLH
jgi:hypothetical protein